MGKFDEAGPIVSLDPGGSTGIAVWYSNSEPIHTRTLTGQHHQGLYKFLMGTYPKAVVCENFDYERGRQKVVLTSVEYIGVAKLFCQHYKARFVPSPRMNMTTWKDEKLKRASLWKPSSPHEMDALRHLLRYLSRCGNYHYDKMARP